MSYFDQFMGLLGFDEERERSLPPMMTQFQDPLAGSQPPTAQSMANMPFDAMQQMTQQPMPTSVASGIESPVVQPEQPSFLDKAGEGLKSLAPSREQALRMAMAFNTMRTNTDPNLASALQAELKDLRATRKEGAKSGKTATLIRQMAGAKGLPEAEVARLNSLADATEKGLMTGADALTQAYKRQSGGVNITMGGDQLTPGQEFIDKEFAKDYVPWMGGQSADTASQIASLEEVLGKLESGVPLTGPVIGQVPDFVNAFLNPQATASREQVEQVVQRNLKAVLGAQFTEKEGEKLIKRAYNPTLSQEENAKRLRLLLGAMTNALQNKNEMTKYFQEKGTLAGYTGRVPTINDMWSVMSNLQVGKQYGNKTYVGGDPSMKSSWK